MRSVIVITLLSLLAFQGRGAATHKRADAFGVRVVLANHGGALLRIARE
jgi:hypothetical protein